MGHAADASALLWRHPRPESTPMWRFIQHVNTRHRLGLRGYPDLYKWSVDNVAAFWADVWDFFGIVASQMAPQVRRPRPSSDQPKRV